ncbi:hypothetical protein J3E68DRAFT_244849 [Trichoderma sp. SZMC 28012]
MHIAFNTTQAVPDFDSTATNREQGLLGPCQGPPRLFFFSSHQPSPGGAHVGANYPRQGRPRPEIRHQGWAIMAAVSFTERCATDWDYLGEAMGVWPQANGGVVCLSHLTFEARRESALLRHEGEKQLGQQRR